MNDYAFGNFLCALREEHDLTQAALAQQLGVTAAAVSKWENGESKPRIETLFRLAEILGVRAEELIAGKRIPNELMDPRAVQEIYKRYDYLTRVEPYTQTRIKVRRILAVLFDYLVTGVLFMTSLLITFVSLGTSGAMSSLPAQESAFIVESIVESLCILPGWFYFVLRDTVCGGRSLGKRVFRLHILDRRSGTKPKLWQLFVRDLFFGIYHIDCIVMLVRGQSIGDSVAHTVVVDRRVSELPPENQTRIQQINAYPVAYMQPANTYSPAPPPSGTPLYIPPNKPKKLTRGKLALLIVGGICLFALLVTLFFGGIAYLLNIVKETPQYQAAYTHLIQSERFQSLDAEEEDIWFTGYSSQKTGYSDQTQHVCEFSFIVNGRPLSVRCTLQDDVWVVDTAHSVS